MMTLVTDGSFMAKELEAKDIELKDYIFTPKEITVNGNSVIDYTDVENDKIFLCNKKDILDKPRPSWIPELDEKGLALDKFLPVCVKIFLMETILCKAKFIQVKKIQTVNLFIKIRFIKCL